MAVETTVTEPRNEQRSSSVSWGAIFSAAFIIIAIQMVFTLLGSAIGFTIVGPEGAPSGIGIGAGIYFFITMLISFFLGGYVASRLAGYRTLLRGSSALHGLTSWAVVITAFTFLLGSGLTAAVSGIFNLAGDSVQAVSSLSQQGGIIPESFKEDVRQSLKQRTQKQKAESSQKSGQAAKSQQKGTVQKAATVVARGSWIGFFTLLGSAIAAMLGGMFGSANKLYPKKQVHVEKRAA